MQSNACKLLVSPLKKFSLIKHQTWHSFSLSFGKRQIILWWEVFSQSIWQFWGEMKKFGGEIYWGIKPNSMELKSE